MRLKNSTPEVTRSMAYEVLDSCAVGDHSLLKLPALRALRGFQQILCAVLFRAEPAPDRSIPTSQVVFVVANPVAHGARLASTVRSHVRSCSFSLLADTRLAEDGLLIEHSFPGVSAKSLVGSVSLGGLRFALRLRMRLPRGTRLKGSTSWLYREYLFVAQGLRYAACWSSALAMARSTLVLTDYDRSAYCRPWVWAANATGMKTATMIHGSPNEANYVPLLAKHALVWGPVQKKWLEEKSPGSAVIVIGRPDLEAPRFASPYPARRIVLCHSREVLSLAETNTLIADLSRFKAAGLQISLRLHPSAREEDLDRRWRAVASLADEIVVSRGSFTASLRRSDVVLCVSSSSAVEATAAGVPVVVIADNSRNLPSDLEAIRSAAPAILREVDALGEGDGGSSPQLARLAAQLLEATGPRAGGLLDLALLDIHSDNFPVGSQER